MRNSSVQFLRPLRVASMPLLLGISIIKPVKQPLAVPCLAAWSSSGVCAWYVYHYAKLKCSIPIFLPTSTKCYQLTLNLPSIAPNYDLLRDFVDLNDRQWDNRPQRFESGSILVSIIHMWSVAECRTDQIRLFMPAEHRRTHELVYHRAALFPRFRPGRRRGFDRMDGPIPRLGIGWLTPNAPVESHHDYITSHTADASWASSIICSRARIDRNAPRSSSGDPSVDLKVHQLMKVPMLSNRNNCTIAIGLSYVRVNHHP
jgi:hypothetical protein